MKGERPVARRRVAVRDVITGMSDMGSSVNFGRTQQWPRHDGDGLRRWRARPRPIGRRRVPGRAGRAPVGPGTAGRAARLTSVHFRDETRFQE